MLMNLIFIDCFGGALGLSETIVVGPDTTTA
jgi:hypothetical protein